jgi:serine O-acetyltransferase
MSPEGMWRLAIRLRKKRLVWLAKRVKNLCSILFHNSLAIGAEVDEGLYLGHHGLGVVVHDNVVLGKRVKIWQGVTLAVRAPAGSQPKIVVGDDVMIGANVVVVTLLREGLSVGSGRGSARARWSFATYPPARRWSGTRHGWSGSGLHPTDPRPRLTR